MACMYVCDGGTWLVGEIQVGTLQFRGYGTVSPTCRRQGQPFLPSHSLSPSAWTCTAHNLTHNLPYTGPQTSNLTTEKKQLGPTFGDACRTPSLRLHTSCCPSHVCCPGHQTSYSICRAMATIDPSPLCLTHPSRRPRTVSANTLTGQSPDQKSTWRLSLARPFFPTTATAAACNPERTLLEPRHKILCY